MDIFHKRLKSAIKRANLTQSEIAKRFNIKQSSVWEWLNTGYPSLDKFKLLCDMLNANPAYILGLVGEEDMFLSVRRGKPQEVDSSSQPNNA